MDYNACAELQRELVYRLQREVLFYRSLFVLIERQRDAAERGAGSELAISYADFEAILGGLRESQFAISRMQEKEPTLFDAAVRIPPVPELVLQATEILAAAHRSLQEGARSARIHYRRLQTELTRLGRDHHLLRASPLDSTGRAAVDDPPARGDP